MRKLTRRRLQDGMDNHWTSSYVSQILDDHLTLSPASVVSAIRT
jgi:hypothetical protein